MSRATVHMHCMPRHTNKPSFCCCAICGRHTMQYAYYMCEREHMYHMIWYYMVWQALPV